MWSDAEDLKLRQSSQLPGNLLCLICKAHDAKTQACLGHEHNGLFVVLAGFASPRLSMLPCDRVVMIAEGAQITVQAAMQAVLSKSPAQNAVPAMSQDASDNDLAEGFV